MSREDIDELRVSITPEPSDEELLAIIQALKLLDQDDGAPPPNAQSGWTEIARHQVVRERNWPLQVRSWGFKRW